VKKYYILKIESYDGQDTSIICGINNQDYLFAIVVIDDEGNAEIVDNGYRSRDEAELAWPEAKLSPTKGT
jgi:disulfide oxidoreductase YuzD